MILNTSSPHIAQNIFNAEWRGQQSYGLDGPALPSFTTWNHKLSQYSSLHQWVLCISKCELNVGGSGGWSECSQGHIELKTPWLLFPFASILLGLIDIRNQ
jgi:hypothetical protein